VNQSNKSLTKLNYQVSKFVRGCCCWQKPMQHAAHNVDRN